MEHITWEYRCKECLGLWNSVCHSYFCPSCGSRNIESGTFRS